MTKQTEKELLEKIDNLEKMLMQCKKNLASLQKSFDIITTAFTKKGKNNL